LLTEFRIWAHPANTFDVRRRLSAGTFGGMLEAGSYMGTFMEKITLTNAGDISAARNGLIPGTRIRALTLDAMPDTGAWTCTLIR
jgi:hypothetical protein